MVKVEWSWYIYNAIGYVNTQRQENELAAIMKNVILHDGSWSQ